MPQTSCDLVLELLARDAAGRADAGARAAIEEHVGACSACREAREAQAAVVAILAAVPEAPLPVGFAARLSARLDDRASWIDLFDWRRWTLRLAPLAAALLIAALMGEPVNTAPQESDTLAQAVETWASGSVNGGSVSSALIEADVSSEALLETALIGTAGAVESGDAR
jgi:predicted anti-sigma-YlaC factor YlaD